MTTLFDAERRTLPDAIAATAESLRSYGERYAHWVVAYSGGKDSTALVTVVCHLIASGQVLAPKSLSVLYADTRMELPPLHISADAILRAIRKRGHDGRMVLPPLDRRFMPYVLGRGVPPPSNTFRWCTGALKVEPMLNALRSLRDSAGEKLLMLTGVRRGESSARDQRISLSCTRDGGECGQGWFQEATPESVADTLAPLLTWRVCHVWEWLRHHAPAAGFPTAFVIADVYGGANDMEALAESAARTGCVGCNLASRDDALRRTIALPQWSYLEPLTRLKPMYAELKRPCNRLRKPGGETVQDGTLAKNQGRMGPLTLEARLWGLGEVLAMQAEINSAARERNRPEYSLIDSEEEARIRELIDAKTWPQKWTGEEPVADTLQYEINPDGSLQHWLPGLMEE